MRSLSRGRWSLSSSRRIGSAFLVAAVGFVLWSCGCREKVSSRPRNLLLITLDTVRADHLGAYGYAAAETPALDRLAREGVRFDSAVSAAPLTLPSHATILSGLTPPHHGLRNNGAGRFPDDRPTLATLLFANGYATGAFVGSFVLDHRFGLARGFDVYDDEIERDPNAPGSLEAERSGSQVTDRALTWLEKTAGHGRPFFAWVHFYDAHAPYAPPPEYARRHKDSPYDGEIAFVDAQVARLLAFLDRSGLAGSTVVAAAADHGESLGEHGELTHGLLLYEPTLRVPLLLRAPGLPAARQVRTPVGLADVAPTLAGLLGHRLTSDAVGRTSAPLPPDGRDLSAALAGGAEPPETDLYAETEYPRTFGWSGLSALRRGRLKYIGAPHAELYDLARDPREASNLLEPGARRSDLETGLAKLEEGAVSAAPAPGRAETVAKLASLGYIAGTSGAAASPPGAPAKDPKEMAPLFREFEEANRDLREGRLEEAARRTEPLVAADPKNSVFRGLLAEASRRRNEYPRAIALYRRAVADAPDDPDARYNLAVTLQEAGRVAEALAALQEAIRRDSSRPEAHNALGIALSSEGEFPQALAEFDRAVELDPRDARAQNNRGNVLRQLRRFEEAERAYRRSIELAPLYAEAWNGLGALEVARGRPSAALPDFAHALEIAPKYHEARLNRGIAFETLGDARSAVAAYRDFLREAAGDPGFAEQRAVARQLIARLSGSRSLSSVPEGR